MAGENDQSSQGETNNASAGSQDWSAWGSAIGGLLSGVGGFFGGGGMSSGQKEDQRFIANFQMQQAIRNEEFSRFMAHNGIRVRAADAEAAGLHPLAALGVSSASGGFGGGVQQLGFDGGGSNVGRGLENLGQNISRATSVASSPQEKAFKALQLDSMAIQNELARTALAKQRQELVSGGAGVGISNAGYTIPGQPDPSRPTMQVLPSRSTVSEPGAPQQTLGLKPLYEMNKGKNFIMGLLSPQAAESTEEDWKAKAAIALMELMSGKQGPQTTNSRMNLPAGYDRWAYNGLAYVPMKPGKQTRWELFHSIPSPLGSRRFMGKRTKHETFWGGR